MATLWNPFSYKNNEPKYPDGLAQYSIGRKWTNISRVRGKDIVICLYPGLLGWCCIAASTVDSETEFKQYDIHTTQESLQYTYSATEVGSVQPGTVELRKVSKWVVSTNRFSAWRPVSLAVKIKSINRLVGNCGRNDGWWEAIRSSKNITPLEFGIITESIPEKAPVGTLFPNTKFLFTANQAQNWSLMPSYQTGSIMDLSKWCFQSNQIRNDNNFIDVTDIAYDYPSAAIYADHYQQDDLQRLEYPTMQDNPTIVPYVDGITYQTFPYNADQPSVLVGETDPVGYTSFPLGYQSTHATSLDMILIKLHGTSESEYQISSVCNQEFLANDTDLKDYQTTSYAAHKELEEYLQIRSRDYKNPNHTYYSKKEKF